MYVCVHHYLLLNSYNKQIQATCISKYPILFTPFSFFPFLFLILYPFIYQIIELFCARSYDIRKQE